MPELTDTKVEAAPAADPAARIEDDDDDESDDTIPDLEDAGMLDFIFNLHGANYNTALMPSASGADVVKHLSRLDSRRQ